MFFNNNTEFTKYGYFEINGAKTFSKYEAWQLATNAGMTIDDIQFNFSNDVMDKYDWTVEPKESLSNLYASRAKQIREKYDHVVLLYSGGIDSHVILNTFLDNNIKLDEIITIGNTEFLDKTAKINQEVFGRAIPYINAVNIEKIGAKFKYVDLGKLIQDQFSNQKHFDNFLYCNNGPLSPWFLALRSFMFKQQQEDHVKLAEQGKKICYMWGYDKPNMFNIDGKWCFKFADSVSDFSARAFFNKEIVGGPLKNFYDEAFFVTPDLPDITIKQCHVVLKMLKEIKSNTDPRITPVEFIANTGPFIEHPLGHGSISGTWIKKHALERVIYPDENPDLFGDDKIRGSVMFTARDRWFFKSTHENRNKLIKKYKIMFREQEGYFRYNINGVALNSISIFGKPYFIE